MNPGYGSVQFLLHAVLHHGSETGSHGASHTAFTPSPPRLPRRITHCFFPLSSQAPTAHHTLLFFPSPPRLPRRITHCFYPLSSQAPTAHHTLLLPPLLQEEVSFYIFTTTKRHWFILKHL